MSAAQVEHYVRRARDFFEAMQIFRDDEAFRNTAALLAIHSAISYADALRSALGEPVLRNQDHDRAVDMLQLLLNQRRWKDQTGLDSLAYLLSKKSQISYSERSTDTVMVRSLSVRAERFAKWASNVGSGLKMEGWTL